MTQSDAPIEAFHARDPYVPSEEIRNNLPQAAVSADLCFHRVLRVGDLIRDPVESGRDACKAGTVEQGLEWRYGGNDPSGLYHSTCNPDDGRIYVHIPRTFHPLLPGTGLFSPIVVAMDLWVAIFLLRQFHQNPP